MAEIVKLLDGEYVAEKSAGSWRLYDCDGDVITTLPAEWTQEAMTRWVEGYNVGTKRGEDWGKAMGAHAVRSAILEALGIGEELLGMRNDIQTLAGVLRHHFGDE